MIYNISRVNCFMRIYDLYLELRTLHMSSHPFFSTYRFLLRSHSFQISEKIPLPLLYTLNRGLLFKITPIISFRLISHPQFHSSHVVNDNVTDDNKFICRSFFLCVPDFFYQLRGPV